MHSTVTIIRPVAPDGTIEACVGADLSLTCEIKGHSIGFWTSNEYIGHQQGHRLELAQGGKDNETSLVDPTTVATLVRAYQEDGLTVLEIELQFTVSKETIFTCGGGAEMTTITLKLGRSVQIHTRMIHINPIPVQ